jgi:group I intron endonuclease
MVKNKMNKIYCITNKLNGKRYVGFTTKDINTRFQKHIYTSKKSPFKSPLYDAILKYGKENFECTLLYEGDDALEKEDGFIQLMGNYNTISGGNIPPSFLGHKQSLSARKKISDSKKGVPRPAEMVARNAKKHRGFKHTADSIEKMRIIKTGKKHSLESKEKMSRAKKGIPNSEEHNRKISETKKRQLAARKMEFIS